MAPDDNESMRTILNSWPEMVAWEVKGNMPALQALLVVV